MPAAKPGGSHYSEGSFSYNRRLCVLIQGIDISWKAFCSKQTRSQPYLPLGKMKTSQPAVVVEGTVETKLPCPKVQAWMRVFYLLFTAQPGQTLCVRNSEATLIEVWALGQNHGPLKLQRTFIRPSPGGVGRRHMGKAVCLHSLPSPTSQINPSAWFRLQEAERLEISNEPFSPDVSIIETAGQWGIINRLSFAETAEWH